MTTDTLRTALTKLADEWMRRAPLLPEAQVRDLLAAHPADAVSDTRREDVARALLAAHIAEFEASISRVEASIQDPINTTGGREYDTAKLHGQRGAVYALRRLAEALAVLPAPSAYEAEVRERIAQDIEAEAERMILTSDAWTRGEERHLDGLGLAVRIARGTTR